MKKGDEILMVNSEGLHGMYLSDANKAVKKLPYGPVRVVYCSKLVRLPLQYYRIFISFCGLKMFVVCLISLES